MFNRGAHLRLRLFQIDIRNLRARHGEVSPAAEAFADDLHVDIAQRSAADADQIAVSAEHERGFDAFDADDCDTCAADGVLIPIQCEYFALEGVSALMGTIQKVQKMNRHLAIEGVVLTMLDARTNLGVQVAQEVRKVFKNKVYQTVIPRNVRLGEAPSHGLPISLYDPRSLGAQSYQQLAKEFLARE